MRAGFEPQAGSVGAKRFFFHESPVVWRSYTPLIFDNGVLDIAANNANMKEIEFTVETLAFGSEDGRQDLLHILHCL